MLHTIELPAGVTHLNTSLANMNGNDFSHFCKNKDELTLCEGRKISNEEKELGATTLKHGRASSHPVSKQPTRDKIPQFPQCSNHRSRKQEKKWYTLKTGTAKSWREKMAVITDLICISSVNRYKSVKLQRGRFSSKQIHRSFSVVPVLF